MVTRIAFLLLLLLCRGTVRSQIQFESSGFKHALAKAARLNKPVFIYFYTDWCAPCKQIPAIVFGDSLIRATIDSTYVSLKRNAEKGEGLILAKKYNVAGFPTFLFVDTRGKEFGRVMGTRSNKDYLQIFRKNRVTAPLH